MRKPLLLSLALLVSCGARTDLNPFDGNGGEGTGGRSEGGGGQAQGGDGGGGRGGEGGEGGEGGFVPECDPETTQYIYLVTQESELYSYYPPTNEQRFIGFLDCPSSFSPFSMGVDRTGVAQVLYWNGDTMDPFGEIFRVSMADASCEPTDYVSGQSGFHSFGMGFALDEAGGQEDSLYLAEITFGQTSKGLARLDTDTLELEFIGEFSDNLSDRMEMTGSSDGNLWGFFLNDQGTGGWVVRIDKTTAEILESTFIPAGNGPSALAFAWWGGNFYVFTGTGDGTTTVTRFETSTGGVGPVATLSGTVVGSGVSTCAPGVTPQ